MVMELTQEIELLAAEIALRLNRAESPAMQAWLAETAG